MRTGPGKPFCSTRLLLLAALLGGCVGNIQSADANTHVFELTTPELRFLCSWMDDTIAERRRDEDEDEDEDDSDGSRGSATDEEMCELEATQAAEDATECYQVRTACMNEPEVRYDSGRGCRDSVKTPPRACNATVAQIKACFVARQQELVDAAKAASCGDVRGSRLPGSILVSCRDVFPACESLFGTLGGSSGLPLTMAPSIE
jgi:hypothetical protein